MDNEATDGAGSNVDSGTSLTANNAIYGCNTATTDGGGLFLDGSGTAVSFVNTVLYDDQSASGSSHGAGAYGGSGTMLTMQNSIVYTTISAYALYGAGSGAFYYSDVYNSATSSYTWGGTYSSTSGGISSDPLFGSVNCDGNPNNDDFTLSSGSPAVDAGNSSSSYDDTDGSRNDMGGYGGPQGDW